MLKKKPSKTPSVTLKARNPKNKGKITEIPSQILHDDFSSLSEKIVFQ